MLLISKRPRPSLLPKATANLLQMSRGDTGDARKMCSFGKQPSSSDARRASASPASPSAINMQPLLVSNPHRLVQGEPARAPRRRTRTSEQQSKQRNKVTGKQSERTRQQATKNMEAVCAARVCWWGACLCAWELEQ